MIAVRSLCGICSEYSYALFSDISEADYPVLQKKRLICWKIMCGTLYAVMPNGRKSGNRMQGMTDEELDRINGIRERLICLWKIG
ncbi:MAG: hypothetical protein ACLUI7_06700 [Coprococcus sp.]